MRKVLTVFFAAVAAIWVDAVLAHATLERASPPVGGTVTSSPAEVRLWFSGSLARGSSIEVSGPSGRVGGRASVADRELSVGVPRLAPGNYQVRWRAISTDGHATEGSFGFAVKP